MKLIATVLSLAIVCGGCGSSTSTTPSTAGNANVAAGWTSDSSEYVVADNENNIASLKSGSVSVKSSAGSTVTIYYDETTGLPTKAVVGDIVFVYEWDTTNSTVSIAMIGSDGAIELKRNVSVTAADIAAITGLFTSESAALKDISKASLWEDIQAHPWWYVGKAAGVIGCGAAITGAYASAGTSEIVTAGAFMGTTCGMLLVTSAYEATSADELVGGAAGAPVGSIVTIGIDSMQCAGLSAADCVQAGAGILDAITGTSDTQTTTMADEFTSATASL